MSGVTPGIAATGAATTGAPASADAPTVTGPTRPLVLIGSDTGAALIAALLTTRRAAPDAVVLAGLPGHDRRQEGSWEEELNTRSHCPVHRGTLTEDKAVTRGTLSSAPPPDLLDTAYGEASPIPHLLLAGEADDLTDREALTRLAKSLPTARLTTIRDAHHDVLNDTSHRSVAAEIVTFLETIRDGFPLRPFLNTESSTW
ncbi:alpha/beta hydrolase [Actinoplanes couchii]|uniref:alpha/beta hydrolase n=1 Tax=Actinoplanes couchii TaxID=403638 RepID=UPI001945634B|nr:alpha/beta hydrolase [Actinoplanes couchii]MDR6322099.1 alpha-beta hydrolase superfamily lysophospholipase [Actinoplanes couchii]